MGKRGKYTADRILRLTTAIAMGASYRAASNYASIHEDTFHTWRRRDPGPLRFPAQMTPELAELKQNTAGLTFDEIVGFYEAQAAVKWLATIEQAASDGIWQAAAWKLERRYVESYGRTVRDHRLTGGVGGPEQTAVTVAKPDFAALSADELSTFRLLWRKVTIGSDGANDSDGG
jgi:hypothetical protein